jgi:hypothetical protein
MKRIALFICLISLFASCKKSKDDVKELLDIPFSFSMKNDFTLPKAADSVYNIPEFPVSVKSDNIVNTIPDEFKKNNADINKVKSISIDGVELTIKSPAGQSFSFMKSIEVYLGANGIGETLIASKSGINTISPEPTSLSLDSKNANIIAYVKNPTYYIRTNTTIVKTYKNDILLGSEIKLKAVANIAN